MNIYIHLSIYIYCVYLKYSIVTFFFQKALASNSERAENHIALLLVD